ncbi:MAG: hypothetical protein ACTSPG_00190 [Candidatus Hodarchaeales archaeon]
MTFLLLKLARFISKEEQRQIKKEIRPICRKYSESFEIMSDPWRSKNRILVQIQSRKNNLKEFYSELIENPGIITVIEFFPNAFNFDLSEFKALLDLLINIINSKSPDNTYSIDIRSYCKIPFHKKSIIDRLKKKRIDYTEQASLQLYFEINRSKKNDTLIGRLGKKIQQIAPEHERKTIPAVLVLYSPYTTQEVADFFRLGLSFKTKIIFTDENNKVRLLINKVKKTFFKGIDKVKFEIVPDIHQLISQNPDTCYGFSLWGKKTIYDLAIILNQKRESVNGNSSLTFFFGNEEVGLPLKARQEIPIFRIGTTASEPLRASQAASYILGFLSASKSNLDR